jgi:hypothetical protein
VAEDFGQSLEQHLDVAEGGNSESPVTRQLGSVMHTRTR